MLNGPHIEPLSGSAKQIVVFLHGYGADGHDLIDIGRHWQKALPNAVFLSPHAPEPCAMSSMGRQWFPLTFRDPHEYWRGVNAAAPALQTFLEESLAQYQLPARALALVGFSQGTMMALHIALRQQQPFAGMIGYSGMMAVDPLKDKTELTSAITSRSPVLLVHGDRDDVIPVSALPAAMHILQEAKIPCQGHIAKGLGHGIDHEGLLKGGQFLAEILAHHP
jgi:phospholipase/carboxylesterase